MSCLHVFQSTPFWMAPYKMNYNFANNTLTFKKFHRKLEYRHIGRGIALNLAGS